MREQSTTNTYSLDAEYEFTSRLRAEMMTQNWTVDWQNAPSPFRTYLPKHYVPLYGGTSGAPGGESSALHRIGRLLLYSAGCLQVRRPFRGLPRVRRAVASGGALYPGEVYLYTMSAPNSCALYHYNPARHELAELRRLCLHGHIATALEIPQSEFRATAVVLVTNYFWKSYFKYADFSYRLGAVDIGALVGRLQRMGAQLFGAAATYFDFDDRALNRLLGIDGVEESTYAMLTLGSELAGQGKQTGSLSDLPETPDFFPEHGPARRSAEFDSMHSSVLAGRRLNVAARNGISTPRPARSTVPLPDAANLEQCIYAAIRARSSDGPFFTPGVLEPAALATCLKEGADSSRRVGSGSRSWHSPGLYCAIFRVQGIPEGVYRYNAQDHTLELIKTGNFGAAMQKAMRLDNINLELAACVLHFVGMLDWRQAERGCRAYRIQQMVIGAGLESVMLAAAHFHVTAHPLLGFRAPQIDGIYELSGTREGSLAQICIGPTRHGVFLETPIMI